MHRELQLSDERLWVASQCVSWRDGGITSPSCASELHLEPHLLSKFTIQIYYQKFTIQMAASSGGQGEPVNFGEPVSL